jgi:hypothetical protein
MLFASQNPLKTWTFRRYDGPMVVLDRIYLRARSWKAAHGHAQIAVAMIATTEFGREYHLLSPQP